jgi:hypothetical protein
MPALGGIRSGELAARAAVRRASPASATLAPLGTSTARKRRHHCGDHRWSDLFHKRRYEFSVDGSRWSLTSKRVSCATPVVGVRAFAPFGCQD